MTAAAPHLPVRQGPRPRTTSSNPHTQLDQQPQDRAIRDRLRTELAQLADVVWQPSGISVPGAEALCLARGSGDGPPEAFMIGREFAHLHPDPDFSLHLMVPVDCAEQLMAAAWAEPHPAVRMGLLPATAVMVYAPRDDQEAAVVARIVAASHAFALGGAEDQPD